MTSPATGASGPGFDLGPALEHPFDGINAAAVAHVGPLTRGKVRDVVDLGDRLALVATDRVSAFDRVLGTVPYRGQILNQLAVWWFEQIHDLAPTHILSVPDPNVVIVRKCEPLPVEIVVRAHLSGSTATALWTRYARGEREMYGLAFPDGMAKNDPLPVPVMTPTTKARDGGHDEPISEAEIVRSGLVDAARWDQVHHLALAIFARGRAVAEACGLVLVDTKYELGLDEHGDLVVIDEVHTPDSSRYWRAETLDARRRQGQEPDNLDKEVIRLEYAARGYRGDGDPPPLPADLAIRAAAAYAEAFRRLTGAELVPAPYPAGRRIEEVIGALG
jgi:phosphoribosylaminoimidazole-succinocarboxamide synthase